MYKSILIRATVGLLFSFGMTLAMMPKFISIMRKLAAFQSKRFGTPDSHAKKNTTPIMGGLVLLLVAIITVFTLCDISNRYIIVLLFTTISFGLMGFCDDYQKVFAKSKAGLRARTKILIQVSLACIVIYWLDSYQNCGYYKTHLSIPWLHGATIKLGSFYIIFKICTLVATSNAVNLTDGLDGLVSVPMIINLLFFAFVSYFTYHSGSAFDHKCYHAQDIAEIVVFSSAIAGALFGFLWFNSSPAQIFMGDVGSMSLGAVLAAIAIIMRSELMLVLVGGIFVIEGVSVVLQVMSFKLTGKRIFKIAPFHHHLEACGWSESQIVVRSWIVSILLSIIGFLVIKF